MIRSIFVVVILIFLLACNNSTIDKARYNQANNILIDTTLVNQLQPALQDWLTFYDLDLSKFTPTDTLSVDWNDLKKNTFIYFKKFTPDDEKYMPGTRCYSPDRRRFVDLIESVEDMSGDTLLSTKILLLESPHIEQRIYLYNRIDSTSMLLTTKGRDNLIENSFWLDNDRFVLAGVDRREDNSMFYFTLYRIHEEEIRVFCLPDSTITLQKSYLKDIVLPRRKKR